MRKRTWNKITAETATEVLKLIGEGRSVKQIARRIGRTKMATSSLIQRLEKDPNTFAEIKESDPLLHRRSETSVPVLPKKTYNGVNSKINALVELHWNQLSLEKKLDIITSLTGV